MGLHIVPIIFRKHFTKRFGYFRLLSSESSSFLLYFFIIFVLQKIFQMLKMLFSFLWSSLRNTYFYQWTLSFFSLFWQLDIYIYHIIITFLSLFWILKVIKVILLDVVVLLMFNVLIVLVIKRFFFHFKWISTLWAIRLLLAKHFITLILLISHHLILIIHLTKIVV